MQTHLGLADAPDLYLSLLERAPQSSQVTLARTRTLTLFRCGARQDSRGQTWERSRGKISPKVSNSIQETDNETKYGTLPDDSYMHTHDDVVTPLIGTESGMQSNDTGGRFLCVMLCKFMRVCICVFRGASGLLACANV